MKIDLFTIGHFTVHGYGLMIGLGFLAAYLLLGYRAKKYQLSENDATNIAICVLLFGFLGGKLLYILVEFKAFLQDPLSVIGSEGFVVYGGIITGILTIYIYCRIKKLNFLQYFDILAPEVAVNQAFGRVGCFLAGCCYGRETDSAIGVVFPDGCLAPAGVKLLPTQIFSAGADLALAIILMIYARKTKYKGNVAALYLLLYSIGRPVIEYFRADERGAVGTISTSQFISIFIFLIAVGFFLFNVKTQKSAADTVSDSKTE
ncbi:MAG: prolipoprotein diacylglyceryl transferase [bacterium]|nr:prolipoprotein diacylglyceryl transferase [bacterium]